MLFPLEANDMLFFEPMLIETYVTMEASPISLLRKLYFLLEGMSIQMNISCIFSMVEIKDCKVPASNFFRKGGNAPASASIDA
jgi:hypothetical protein